MTKVAQICQSQVALPIFLVRFVSIYTPEDTKSLILLHDYKFGNVNMTRFSFKLQDQGDSNFNMCFIAPPPYRPDPIVAGM